MFDVIDMVAAVCIGAGISAAGGFWFVDRAMREAMRAQAVCREAIAMGRMETIRADTMRRMLREKGVLHDEEA